MPQEDLPDVPADLVEDDVGMDSRPHGGRGDDPAKFVIVANAALIGVPTAYATSQSVPVAVLAAVVATVFVVVYAVRRPR